MINLLFSWKFWLAIVIIIIIIKWFIHRKKEGPPDYEEPEKIIEKDPELAEIAISIVPNSPYISEDEEILPPSPISEEEEPPPPFIEQEQEEVNLTDNGKASVGEYLTLQALKTILGNREIIRNIRPKYLRNPKTGYPMEIDCYCPELKIGVEYNGIGHYQYPNPFHSTEEEFNDQVERDIVKRQLADKHGVTIFTVPCTIDGVRYDSKKNKYITVKRTRQERYDLILAYLRDQLKVLNL